ncbi:hypothetical protein [Paenibacillus sp. Z6-24]
MKKRFALLLPAALLAVTMSTTSIAAADLQPSDSVSSTAANSSQAALVHASVSQGAENYHSIHFSINFMDTIMLGDTEVRGRFYQALEEAIGAPVIFYDFWNDRIIIKVIDKQLSPEEAEAVKDKINSMEWLHEAYEIPMNQEIITGIYWFDRWA